MVAEEWIQELICFYFPPLCVFDRLQPRLPSCLSYLSTMLACLQQVRDASAADTQGEGQVVVYPKHLLPAGLGSPSTDAQALVW